MGYTWDNSIFKCRNLVTLLYVNFEAVTCAAGNANSCKLSKQKYVMRLHVNGWHHRCINLSSSLMQSRGMCRSCKRCTQPLLTLLKNVIYPCIIYSILWENISMYRIICQEHFRNNLFACYREILTALHYWFNPSNTSWQNIHVLFSRLCIRQSIVSVYSQ